MVSSGDAENAQYPWLPWALILGAVELFTTGLFSPFTCPGTSLSLYLSHPIGLAPIPTAKPRMITSTRYGGLELAHGVEPPTW